MPSAFDKLPSKAPTGDQNSGHVEAPSKNWLMGASREATKCPSDVVNPVLVAAKGSNLLAADGKSAFQDVVAAKPAKGFPACEITNATMADMTREPGMAAANREKDRLFFEERVPKANAGKLQPKIAESDEKKNINVAA